MKNDQLDIMIMEYPDFAHCSIQTFCDDKGREDAKSFARIFSQDDMDCWEQVQKLNKQ